MNNSNSKISKKNNRVIIYLHGFRSTGNSGKTLTLRKMFPEYEIIGPHYSPHNPLLAEQELSSLMDSLTDKQSVLVIGTSLGGFWAHWMARKFNLNAIMINPSIDPGNTLTIGRYTLYDETNTEIEVTQQSLDMASSFRVMQVDAKQLSCFVWVALDDEVLDPQAIINEFTGIHKLKIYDTGSHRFIQFDQMKNEIQAVIDLN
jgi:uncharacterized protein